jgi:hypothetical protein
MPSSRPNIIPTVIHLVQQLRPRSILDVGIGFGKFGHLFREYTDIQAAEHDPRRYARENWKVRIDGIEGYAAYVTDAHRYLYDDIHIGDARQVLATLPRYDLVFMGDVIEHFDKDDGRRLLADALDRATQAVIVSTPKSETGQEDACGNEFERHRSLWSAQDFRDFGGATVKTIDATTLLAVLVKPGIPPLALTPPLQGTVGERRRMSQAKAELTRKIAATEPFVLVDDEAIRSELGHEHAIPFLERDGEYWGQPADDSTAIRELERLRQAGARYVAFISSTFWWLEHYRELRRHLSSFPCPVRNDRLIVFDLRPGEPVAGTGER